MTRKDQTKSAPKAAVPAVSKKDKVLELLRRDGGAALVEITEATSWLPHTARAMLTGLRKKGFGVGKEKVEGINRYSIVEGPAA